ncbi:MAG: 2Fe-2S iron-sulfur cluster binding domain-containing protein [Hydrogenophilales bacterium]|nr:2Fe-2S iron-sulfur cluster binding domain-containing protein [Hydrogenophilales bacterium]
MSTITFLTQPFRDKKLTVRLAPQEQRTLLSLIQEYKLPKKCTCGEGKCGSCAVKVAPMHRQTGPRTVRLSDEERTALFKSGKLSRQQYESDGLPDIPPLWRLACQYVVMDEEIMVAF